MEISKAAVIGAGVMGSGIAAHLANAGVEVLLLDQPQDGPAGRNALAAGAITRMLKAEPAPFMTAKAARLVTPGNIEDDLERLAEADWIVEAIVEDPAAKSNLYAKLAAVAKDGAAISSNTSTIPLAVLTAGMDHSFRRRFLITHFFNPPRYMRLLELVAGPETDPGLAAAIRDFADRRLGKGVIEAKDTPGFIANRIGTYWIQAGMNAAFDLGVTVEEADAVMGRPVGVPKTGIFGLADLVGIDLMPHLSRSLLATLPMDDPYREIARDEPLITRMIEGGLTGRKGKGGFYRLDRRDGRSEKQRIDLASGEYNPAERPKVAAAEAARDGGLEALVGHDSAPGRYAWTVLSSTLAYAAGLVPEISDSITGVDEAMRLGYNWKWGPFELIDRLGAASFAERLAAEGRPVPPLLATAAKAGGFYRRSDADIEALQPDGSYRPVERPEGVLLLADVKRWSEPLLRNGSAALWDLGDGITCFEFTSKMNTLDDQTFDALNKAITLTAEHHRGMVIYNEGSNFSAGANLGVALFLLNIALWGEIEKAVRSGQETYKALKYAPFPVVAAPSGLALGGGCEILLHSDAIQAHAETYTGLVEAGVGLIPAWGGCKEMLYRHVANPRRPKGPMPAIQQVFEMVGTARAAKSAFEAKEMLILRPGDGITMNRDRLLADAKAKALALADGYRPPEPPEGLKLPGPTAEAAMGLAVEMLASQGAATPHDRVVATRLAHILAGGDTDVTEEVGEDGLLALERSAFMALVRTEATLQRMEHMLDTGKPLRN